MSIPTMQFNYWNEEVLCAGTFCSQRSPQNPVVAGIHIASRKPDGSIGSDEVSLILSEESLDKLIEACETAKKQLTQMKVK